MKFLATLCALALAAGLGACATGGGGVRVAARFDCDDGGKLNLTFDHTADAAVLQLAKGKTATLPSKDPASGMWYVGEGYELRGAGDTLTYSAPDHAPTRCVQTR